MNKIEWKVTEQNLSQELVSSDNRWHISKTQSGNADPKFFLSNYDLLLTPHGAGKDYRECFEKFIADCNEFIQKVAAVQNEARMHMEVLLKAAESLENQNKESSHEN
ncbi:MAG: hypothetical protein PHI85_11350 [Victivallaceae bacterium]|nr:hypothetical protein [Victivallaceae bacterium]